MSRTWVRLDPQEPRSCIMWVMLDEQDNWLYIHSELGAGVERRVDMLKRLEESVKWEEVT